MRQKNHQNGRRFGTSRVLARTFESLEDRRLLAFTVKIVSGPTLATSSVSVEGFSNSIVSDKERTTFGIGDDGLKKAIEKYFDKAPDDAYVHSPTPFDDLYKRFGWDEIRTELRVLDARILDLETKPVVIDTKTFTNNTSRAQTFNGEISVQVANTLENNWSSTTGIEVGQSFTYDAKLLGAGAGGETSLGFTSEWGKGGSDSEQTTVGSTTGTEVSVDPGESIEAALTATKGSMTIRVTYEATLSGDTAVNYDNAYECPSCDGAHHFWALPIGAVMTAAGLPLTKTYTDTIKVGFYSNSLVEVNTVDIDDQITEAKRLNVGRATTGEISLPENRSRDVDLYAFSVTARQHVGFDIDTPTSELDSVLRLFDKNGVELRTNDNGTGPSPESEFESYLEYEFTTAGTYYLGVSGIDNVAYDVVTGKGDQFASSTGTYELSMIDLDPVIVNPQDPNTLPKTIYRVNAGGPLDFQLNGKTWFADSDTSVSPLHNLLNNAFVSTVPVNMTHASIPAGTSMSLFQSERWDPEDNQEMQWDIPVDPGQYEVRLYFAEIYYQTAGARVFDVLLEGQKVLNNYDIVADVGPQRGVVKKFAVTSDGNLDLDFGHKIENPKISAIEIVPLISIPFDQFAARRSIVSDQIYTATTTGATRQAGEPLHNGQATEAGVWFTWTAPARGAVKISTAGSRFDTALATYTGTSLDALQLVTANDDVSIFNTSSEVNFTALPGVSYQIAVTGKNADSGDAQLMLSFQPDVVPRFDVTSASDKIIIVDGINDADSDKGPPPGNEGVAHALDNVTDKYLNFLDIGSGFIVAPRIGSTVVSGLRLYTANDSPDRDPASYRLEGSNTGINGPFSLISQGNLSLPAGRNPSGALIDGTQWNQQIEFTNATQYQVYRLVFPKLKNAGLANSMQIGEVEFLGVKADVHRVPGDSNGDGRFDSSDLVAVFSAGEYEDAIVGNSTFEEGDWNGDRDFDTSDLVYAFAAGLYEQRSILPALVASLTDDDLDRRRGRLRSQRDASADADLVDAVFGAELRAEESSSDRLVWGH